MSFLRAVLAAEEVDKEKVLQDARTAIVKRLLKGDDSSVSFKRLLPSWRKAWKDFHGYSMSPRQEKLYLEVLKEKPKASDEALERELKKA